MRTPAPRSLAGINRLSSDLMRQERGHEFDFGAYPLLLDNDQAQRLQIVKIAADGFVGFSRISFGLVGG